MDPRIARTRRSLRDALFTLTREHSLDEISVSDIAERAGVNRSTFYQHYPDKDTLLADSLDAVIDDSIGIDPPTTEAGGAEVLTHFLVHVHEHAALYRQLLGADGSAMIHARVTHRLQTILATALERGEPLWLEGVPTHIAAAAIAGSAIAATQAWLETEPLAEPEVAAEWIWTVINSHRAPDPPSGSGA